MTSAGPVAGTSSASHTGENMTLQEELRTKHGNESDSGRVVDYRDHDQIERLIEDGWVYIGDQQWNPPNSQAVDDAPSQFLPRLVGDTVHDDSLFLTHPVIDDAPAICANELDAELRRHAIFPPTSVASMQRLIVDSYPGWRVGSATFLIGRRTIDGPAVTKLSIRRLIPPGVLDVGYATLTAHRGHGHAAHALRLFTRWAFEGAGIQRIELGIKPENRASVSTALKAGYRLESVRRSRLRNADGSFCDEHSYIAINNDTARAWKDLA